MGSQAPKIGKADGTLPIAPDNVAFGRQNPLRCTRDGTGQLKARHARKITARAKAALDLPSKEEFVAGDSD